ncbi:MAG: DUF3772 domain-containing protein, partial [Albidovulum sp.]
MKTIRRFLAALSFVLALQVVVLSCVVASGAIAQTQAAFNFDAWEKDAVIAEEMIANSAPTPRLDSIRETIVGWRSRLDESKNINAAQIETLQRQIAALP